MECFDKPSEIGKEVKGGRGGDKEMGEWDKRGTNVLLGKGSGYQCCPRL